LVDVPRQVGDWLRRLQFAEVVVDAVVVLRQLDVVEDIVAGGAARRADGILAVEPADWLRLLNRVGAGPQLVEEIETVAVGLRDPGHVSPSVIDAEQGDGSAANARFARVEM